MFYLGVDLGQRADHSAIVVVERNPAGLLVRYVERVALATPYPRVVEIIRAVVAAPEIATTGCSLAVDATGVGSPVVDLLRKARLGCELQPVTITGGEHASRQSSLYGCAFNVPKQDLLMGIVIALEKGELKIARDLKQTASLIREMLDIRSLTSKIGKLRWGAEAAGQHDDLVIALALACWSAGRKRNSIGNQNLGIY